jgi:hypothetical protein
MVPEPLILTKQGSLSTSCRKHVDITWRLGFRVFLSKSNLVSRGITYAVPMHYPNV